MPIRDAARQPVPGSRCGRPRVAARARTDLRRVPAVRGGAAARGDLMQMDTDGDGKVSREEAPEPMRDFFDRLDSNGDGFIDRSEANAMRQRLRGRRPGPGGVPDAGGPGGWTGWTTRRTTGRRPRGGTLTRWSCARRGPGASRLRPGDGRRLLGVVFLRMMSCRP